MIEINVISHDSPLGTARSESIATVTITEDGRGTPWSQKTRTQSLVETWSLTTDHDIWRHIAEITTSIAAAQQTTTTRERPDAPVVRRPGVSFPNAAFRG